MPYLVGLGAVIVAMALMKVVANTWNPLRLARGEDGKTSTSKLQFVLWTGVIAFSYVVLLAERIRAKDVTPIDDLPRNVLIAMGLSVVTLAGAKGITVSYLNSGRVVKTPAEEGAPGAVVDDGGNVDLVKIQMLLWTAIAIVAYLFDVIDQVEASDFDMLPDIDASLMVLMGLGQGAYLGSKLVTTTTPRLTSLTPSAAAPGDTVSLTGAAIGTTQTGTQVTMDGSVIAATSAADTPDSAITFTVPDAHPTKGAWPANGMLVQIGAVASGTTSANTMPLTVKPSG
ncbi:MAG: hypothetical protein M3323_08585 [Actinomycetota bacterium]|nr:hypothetical protein [Actinomycetota bacterium]